MPITVGGTTITFNDGTTQTTAAGGAPAFGAVGSVLPLMNRSNSSPATGGTIAGSSLSYNYQTTNAGATVVSSLNGNVPGASSICGTRAQQNNSSNTSGTTVSGTWMRLDSGVIYASYGNCCGTAYIWGVGLFQRVS